MVSNMVKTAIVGSVGVAVIILSSTLGWILVPDIATSEAVITKDNEAVYGAWTIPPVPIYLEFFLFNCTNCDDPTNGSVVLNLDQLGPFSFTEGRIKFNVIEENGLLSYRENISYFYTPKDGERDLDVNVTTVNPVYFTLASLISDNAQTPAIATKLSGLMHELLADEGEHPFMTHTVREMLFEGWSLQPYVNILELLYEQLSNNTDLTLPPLPELPEDPKFGFFYGRNGTNLGEFTIESGANDLNELGYIKKWNGKSSVEYWNDTFCNMINGTDGAIYPPIVDVNEKIYVFTPDVCRSLYATYEKDTVTEGITGRRFTVPEIVFDTLDPENVCYCSQYRENPDLCFSRGVLDMRPCLLGVPVVLSTPHFYMADPKYVDAFVGLKPNKDWHETHFDLEPLLGVPLFASKRLQLNIDARRYKVPERFLNISDTVFPVIWLNESAKLDAATANDVNKAVNVIDALNISRWCFLGAGIALVVASLIMLVVYLTR
ncbi:lysosome membrane protein 2-like [Daphnia pulex]|uniref:lysosome membrane protein 2-like n=1 Tax=Daphnia pulex TaxID=6669 RepID=UPI001EDEFCE9|nr:lysosome membrane protein 2-like [Daphnia pulex]